jgi:hypothetical protein
MTPKPHARPANGAPRTVCTMQEIKHNGSAEPWRAACKRARCLKLKFVYNLYMCLYSSLFIWIYTYKTMS